MFYVYRENSFGSPFTTGNSWNGLKRLQWHLNNRKAISCNVRRQLNKK